MIIVLTELELKSATKVLSFGKYSRTLEKQLKASNCPGFDKMGAWTTHYHMVMWRNKQEQMAFEATAGAKEAHSILSSIVSQVKTYTYENDKLPAWGDAKYLLQRGEVQTFR